MCNPSIFRTVVYSESNAYFCTAKHLSRNILCKTLCNPDIFRILGIFRTLVYSEIEAYLEPCKYIRWSSLLRTLCSYSRFRGPAYSKHSHIQNRCVSASPKCISCFLELLKYYCIHLKKLELLLSCSHFQLRLSKWAKRLLIAHSIIDIWQKFGNGLRFKRKEKYSYNQKCNNITNNSKKWSSGK